MSILSENFFKHFFLRNIHIFWKISQEMLMFNFKQCVRTYVVFKCSVNPLYPTGQFLTPKLVL